MKISWCVLTYNRADKVKKSVEHNIRTAGYPIHEMVWVDNGSTDGVREVMSSFNPQVSILFPQNMGVAKGYNTAMHNSIGDYIVLTGCDMLMPNNWLKTLAECFEKIPNTGVVSMYSGPLKWVPERIRGNIEGEEINGIHIVRAMPFGRRMFSRKLLGDVGYLREDFGLYGWEDVEWGHRAERVCDEKHLLYYVLPDIIVDHIGFKKAGVQWDEDYDAFKAKEANDPKKQELMAWCRQRGYPRYDPYAA